MFKFIKSLFKIILGLAVLAIVAMIGLFLFVNPNQFKGTIEQQVLAKTGQTLTIQGPISWQWSPILSLALENVVLDNAPPFKDKMLSANKVGATLGLNALFKGKVFINLSLDGIQLNLSKNSAGQTNWQNLVNHLKGSNADAANHPMAPIQLAEASTVLGPQIASTDIAMDTTTNKAKREGQSQTLPDSNPKSLPIQIQINNLQVKNANINFNDETTHQHYKIDHLNLAIDHIMEGLNGQFIPLSLDLDFIKANTALNKLSLNVDWALQPIKDELELKNLVLSLMLPSNNGLTLNGAMKVASLSQNPSVEGTLESNAININGLLDHFNVSTHPAIPERIDVKTRFKYLASNLNIEGLKINLPDQSNLEGNFKINLAHVTPKSLELEGNFIGKNIKYNKILVDEVKGKIASKDGLIHLDPIDITIAQGVHHASIEANLKGGVPKFNLTGHGKDFEIKTLLALFDVQNKIEGKTQYNFKLAATGTNKAELQNSLSGHTELSIQNGKFFGADLIKLIKNAQTGVHTVVSAVTQKSGMSFRSGFKNIENTISEWKKDSIGVAASTPFNTIHASTTINNGLVKNPNLSIMHPEYQVTGAGDVNLINSEIHYQTSLTLKNNPFPPQDKLGHYLYQTPLPVKIQGTIQDPVIRPDLKVYTDSAIRYAEQNLVEKVVEKTVNKTVNKVVEKAVGKALNEKAKGKVNDELQKALGNILNTGL